MIVLFALEFSDETYRANSITEKKNSSTMHEITKNTHTHKQKHCASLKNKFLETVHSSYNFHQLFFFNAAHSAA